MEVWVGYIPTHFNSNIRKDNRYFNEIFRAQSGQQTIVFYSLESHSLAVAASCSIADATSYSLTKANSSPVCPPSPSLIDATTSYHLSSTSKPLVPSLSGRSRPALVFVRGIDTTTEKFHPRNPIVLSSSNCSPASSRRLLVNLVTGLLVVDI
ncbi:hypothetical protein ACLOJK_011360 [Asimina triloba]